MKRHICIVVMVLVSGCGRKQYPSSTAPSPLGNLVPPQVAAPAQTKPQPPSVECLAALEEEEGKFATHFRLPELRRRLEVVLSHVSIGELDQIRNHPETAGAIYRQVAVGAGISVADYPEARSRSRRHWEVGAYEPEGRLSAPNTLFFSWIYDAPVSYAVDVQVVTLAYVAGEESYRLSFKSGLGAKRSSIRQALFQGLDACKGSKLGEDEADSPYPSTLHL